MAGTTGPGNKADRLGGRSGGQNRGIGKVHSIRRQIAERLNRQINRGAQPTTPNTLRGLIDDRQQLVDQRRSIDTV